MTLLFEKEDFISHYSLLTDLVDRLSSLLWTSSTFANKPFLVTACFLLS